MSGIVQDSTPRDDGFFMPAERDLHAGCWMLWPERTDTWRLGAEPAQRAFSTVAATISRFEPVTVGVSQNQYLNARNQLCPTIRLIELSSNDAWMRDCGPTFLVDGNGRLSGVDWCFNAWGGLHGGLYHPWDQDDLVARKVLELEGAARYDSDLVLEGGAIDVDGQGTLITTEQCVLNPNRNPNWSKARVEQHFADYLGIDKVIWLPHGVYDDETDGHVDNLCSYVRPGVIALTWTDDQSDPQFDISREAFEFFRTTTDARGRSFEVHKIDQPGPLYMTAVEAESIDRSAEDAAPSALSRQEGDRLAGSYVNFYIANGGVIVPTFDDPNDDGALISIQMLFPERTIVPVPGREILLGGGCIHCITQQQPATS